MLCSKCRVLFFEFPTPETISRGIVRSKDVVCVLQETRASFLNSIQAGCHLCTLVSAQLDEAEDERPECDELGAYAVLIIGKDVFNLHQGRKAALRVASVGGYANMEIELTGGLPIMYSTMLEDQRVAFQQSDGTRGKVERRGPWSGICTAPRGQVVNIGLAQAWLENCLRHHSLCRSRSPNPELAPMPTRLLDVRDVNKIFLRETINIPLSPYVALSYKWGLGKRFVTERGNIEKHRQGIVTSRLPATFRDAVTAVNWLGYRYIWIDALCIIQDDQDDTKREIGSMGDIYRHAVLTICAQGAASSYDGLFRDRNPLENHPCRTQIALRSGGSASSYDVLIKGTAFSENHLESRGWILQEEVLTSRALVFGGLQMEWSCEESHASETDPVPAAWTKPAGGSTQLSRASATLAMGAWLFGHTTHQFPSGRFGVRPGYMIAWYKMVEEYSDRLLTVASDTLAALAGISAIFADVFHATYLAGLWKDDILHGLMWYVGVNDDREGMLPPETKLTAPSWSWAAVGKVRVRFANLATKPSQHGPRWPRVSETEVLDAFCMSLDPITDALHTSRADTEKQWQLSLRGPTQRFVVRFDPRFSDWRVNEVIYKQTIAGPSSQFEAAHSTSFVDNVTPRFPAVLVHPVDNRVIGEAALDSGILPHPPVSSVPAGIPSQKATGNTTVHQTEVLCMWLGEERLTRRWSEEKWAVRTLILVPSRPGSSSYIRLGLGTVYDRGWFDEKLGDGPVKCEIL